MYKDDIISKSAQDTIEGVCRSAELNLRSDMEYAIYLAVHDAYEKGFKDGQKTSYPKPLLYRELFRR